LYNNIACSYYDHCLLSSFTPFELWKCIYIDSLHIEIYCVSILLSNINRDHLDEHNYFLHIPNLAEQNIEDVDEKVNGKYFLTHQYHIFFWNKKLIHLVNLYGAYKVLHWNYILIFTIFLQSRTCNDIHNHSWC